MAYQDPGFPTLSELMLAEHHYGNVPLSCSRAMPPCTPRSGHRRPSLEPYSSIPVVVASEEVAVHRDLQQEPKQDSIGPDSGCCVSRYPVELVEVFCALLSERQVGLGGRVTLQPPVQLLLLTLSLCALRSSLEALRRLPGLRARKTTHFRRRGPRSCRPHRRAVRPEHQPQQALR